MQMHVFHASRLPTNYCLQLREDHYGPLCNVQATGPYLLSM